MSIQKLFILNVLLGSFQSVFCAETTQPTIMAVAMLTRHGDRAPTGGYLNDPYINYKWLSGYGTLTQKGIRGLYKSGMIKAKRYASILNENCVTYPGRIFVQSSAIERCIASAENFLSGFVPDIWQYVKINVPKDDGAQDEMLTYPGKPCKNYDTLNDNMMDLKRPEVIEMAGGAELIQYVSNHSGVIFNNFGEIFGIADTIVVESENDMPLPPWAAPIYNDYMVPILKNLFQIFAESNVSLTKSGVLMNDMINRLDRYTNSSSEENIILYSAHDANVCSLLSFLRVFDQTPPRPDYGSMVAIELHRNAAFLNDVEVKIFYFANHSEENPLDISIPNCPAPCPFNQFKALIEPRLVTNYDQIATSCSSLLP